MTPSGLRTGALLCLAAGVLDLLLLNGLWLPPLFAETGAKVESISESPPSYQEGGAQSDSRVKGTPPETSAPALIKAEGPKAQPPDASAEDKGQGVLSDDKLSTEPVNRAVARSSSVTEPVTGSRSQQVVVNELEVRFQTSSAALNEPVLRSLEPVLAILRAQPNTTVRIEGHADRRGDAVANFSLSQARASQVAAYFAGAGIPTSRIRTESFGAERPLAIGENLKAYAANRRVKVVVLKGDL